MAKKMKSYIIRSRNIATLLFMVNVLTGCISDLFSTGVKASFDYSPQTSIKSGDTLTFTNHSKNANAYLWDFGDSCQSSEKEPKHAFKAKGNYLVKLFAIKRDFSGNKYEEETDSVSMTIKVSIGMPKANFSYKRNSPLLISFSDSSFQASEYVWNFGDGTTSTEKEPTHTYASYGNYQVTLTTKNDGQSNSVTKTVNVSDVVSLNNTNITIGTRSGTLDVDFDGTADFRFYFNVYGGFISGSGYYLLLTPFNNYEIVADSIRTTVYDNVSFTQYLQTFYIPKIFVSGNSITNSDFAKNTELYIRADWRTINQTSYTFDPWTKDDVRFIGFRKTADNKTKIGWIKLKVLEDITLISFKIPTEASSILIDK